MNHAAQRLLFPLLLVCSAIGCSDGVHISGSKLDAEEAGYRNEFWTTHLHVSDGAHDDFNAIQDAAKFERLGQDEKRKASIETLTGSFDNIQDEANEWLAQLNKTLPPASLADAHTKLVRLLENAQNTNDANDIETECEEYFAAITAFDKTLDERPYPETRSGMWNVVYSPPGSPIGVGVSGGKFTVDVTFNTPAGDFTLGTTNSSGVDKLVIRADGTQRFFSLDRGFKVFVPTDYGVEVSVEDDEVIYIDVKHKP